MCFDISMQHPLQRSVGDALVPQECMNCLPAYSRVCAGLEPSGLPEGTTIYPESQEPGSGQGLDGEGKKKVPVKDERNWLLKNWIFLIPAGMLVCSPSRT